MLPIDDAKIWRRRSKCMFVSERLMPAVRRSSSSTESSVASLRSTGTVNGSMVMGEVQEAWDRACELVLFAGGCPRKSGGVGLGILEAGAGVVEHDAVRWLQEAVGEQLAGRGDAGGAFGRGVDAFRGGQQNAVIEHLGVAHRD